MNNELQTSRPSISKRVVGWLVLVGSILLTVWGAHMFTVGIKWSSQYVLYVGIIDIRGHISSEVVLTVGLTLFALFVFGLGIYSMHASFRKWFAGSEDKVYGRVTPIVIAIAVFVLFFYTNIIMSPLALSVGLQP